MLPVGIHGRKLIGQFRDAVNKPTALVAGIILFTGRSGIHGSDMVRLMKSGTIRTGKAREKSGAVFVGSALQKQPDPYHFVQ